MDNEMDARCLHGFEFPETFFFFFGGGGGGTGYLQLG